MSERTVHALRHDAYQIVRYDNAGKWWAERGALRFPLPTVRDAIEYAADDLAIHYVGLPGGKVFDAGLKRLGI